MKTTTEENGNLIKTSIGKETTTESMITEKGQSIRVREKSTETEKRIGKKITMKGIVSEIGIEVTKRRSIRKDEGHTRQVAQVEKVVKD